MFLVSHFFPKLNWLFLIIRKVYFGILQDLCFLDFYLPHSLFTCFKAISSTIFAKMIRLLVNSAFIMIQTKS